MSNAVGVTGGGWPRKAGRAMAVAFAAALLCWPALWNGYPLLMSDSAEYIHDGSPIWGTLLQPSDLRLIETRSEIYSLVILPLHRNVTAWPVIAWQALLTAWTLWLVVRGMAVRRPLAGSMGEGSLVACYLAIVAGLALCSDVAWHVSYVLPDILGPVLYLCLFLLVFADETLQRWEFVAVMAMAWWCVAAHASHLVVACGVCALLGLAWLLRWQAMRRRGRGLLTIFGVVLLAAGAQTALHQRIYRQASLFGLRPPFLMARSIADGPAKLYLRQHCATLHWTICSYVDRLPDHDAVFLWDPRGIWMTATWQQQRALFAEEMPLVRGTLHAYPRQQIERSLLNFYRQLTTFGIQPVPDFNFIPADTLNGLFPGLNERYHGTLQSRDALHEGVFRDLYDPVVVLSALAIGGLLPWVWRSRQPALQGLCAVVLFTVVANAFVAGVTSGVYARYQGRVIWLLPLLACLLVWVRVDAWRHRVTHRGRERSSMAASDLY